MQAKSELEILAEHHRFDLFMQFNILRYQVKKDLSERKRTPGQIPGKCEWPKSIMISYSKSIVLRTLRNIRMARLNFRGFTVLPEG